MIKQELNFRGPGYWDRSNMPHEFHTKTTDTGDSIQVRNTDYPSMTNYDDESIVKKRKTKKNKKTRFSNK